MKEKRKGNNGLIVLVVILSILLLGAIGYICYDKFYTKEDTKVEEEKIPKIDEDTARELNDSLVSGGVSMFNGGYFLYNSADNISIDNVSIDVIMPYVLRKYSIDKNINISSKDNQTCFGYYGEGEEHHFWKFNDYNQEEHVKLAKDDVVSIQKVQIDEYLRKLFNTDRVFEIDDFHYFNFNDLDIGYVYLKEDDKFYLTNNCNISQDVIGGPVHSEFLSFNQNGDIVTINSKVMKCNYTHEMNGAMVCDNGKNLGKSESESGKRISSNEKMCSSGYMKNCISDEKIYENHKVNFDYLYKNYGDVFNTYKTTFKLGDDGNYYWVSSEIVKE